MYAMLIVLNLIDLFIDFDCLYLFELIDFFNFVFLMINFVFLLQIFC